MCAVFAVSKTPPGAPPAQPIPPDGVTRPPAQPDPSDGVARPPADPGAGAGSVTLPRDVTALPNDSSAAKAVTQARSHMQEALEQIQSIPEGQPGEVAVRKGAYDLNIKAQKLIEQAYGDKSVTLPDRQVLKEADAKLEWSGWKLLGKDPLTKEKLPNGPSPSGAIHDVQTAISLLSALVDPNAAPPASPPGEAPDPGDGAAPPPPNEGGDPGAGSPDDPGDGGAAPPPPGNDGGSGGGDS